MDFVSYKDRKAVATALKDIYRAVDAKAAEAALAAFEAGPWGQKYPAISQRVVVQTELRAGRTNRWLGICYASNTLFRISGAVLPVIRRLERSNWRL